jgi:hypothetical protein
MTEPHEAATAVAQTVSARELQARYAAEAALDRQDAQRLIALRDQSFERELSREEMLERVVLERTREDREPRLRRLELEAAAAAEAVNIAEVLSIWDGLRAQKAAAYVGVRDAITNLYLAWQEVFHVHQLQEEEWAKLPRAGSSLSAFPSGAGLAQWITGRMPFGWSGILDSAHQQAWQIDWAAVFDVDPGLKALHETTIGRIQEQARLWRQRMAQQIDVSLDTEAVEEEC